MTANISEVNPLVNTTSVSRVNNQIRDINDKISTQKSEVVVIKSLLAKNQEEKDVIEQLIKAKKQIYTNNEKQIDITQKLIDVHKQVKSDTEALIEVHIKKIGILEQLRYNNEGLIVSNKEQRGLLIEARDLLKESRDAAIKVVEANNSLLKTAIEAKDLNKNAIEICEKMIAIMMKNPTKYGVLSNAEIQKQPEIIEAKSQVTKLMGSKIEPYPKEKHTVLMNTIENVVDATFLEIKPTTNVKIDNKLFYDLSERIESALDKKYEILSVKDVRRIMNAHYQSIKHFAKIKNLNYLNLALKDIKV